jgi:hypothetical protein
MSGSVPEEALVVLTVSPAIEEAVIDWLLARREGSGFTSMPVSGHSARQQGLSNLEQVTGRQRRVQFQMEMRGQDVDAFLENARATFGGADIHFWVVPVLSAGRLGHATAAPSGR